MSPIVTVTSVASSARLHSQTIFIWVPASSAVVLRCTNLIEGSGASEMEKGLEAGEGGGGRVAAPVAFGEATVVVSERRAKGLRDRWWVVGGCVRLVARWGKKGSRERGAPYETCGIERDGDRLSYVFFYLRVAVGKY